MMRIRIWCFVLVVLSCMACRICVAQPANDTDWLNKIDREVLDLKKQGDIPGLSVIIIKDGKPIIRSYGYANVERRTPVTISTIFELGSCSKAFTALAVLQLIENGRLHLDSAISLYIPWFHVRYKGVPATITVRQLLHHTSGIPWYTIANIPATNERSALQQTVQTLNGIALKTPPGTAFEYATINYDVLALAIENVSGQSFESFVTTNIIRPLQLNSTNIGQGTFKHDLADGHKIGFFKARPYTAPVYRGNNAAGYVLSNAQDMAAWLQFQMGMTGHSIYQLALKSQQRDETVPLHGMSAYAMGWEVVLNGKQEIRHDGQNPNFSSYVAMRPGKKLGVAVLANSNSSFTAIIGSRLMNLAAGEAPPKVFEVDDRNDKVYSIIAVILTVYILVVAGLLVRMLLLIVTGKRKYEGFSFAKLGRLLLVLLLLLPFAYSVYILPHAMANFNWDAMIVWAPVSLPVMLGAIVLAVLLSYLALFISLLFPEKNKFKKAVPVIVLMSILSGVANMIVIALITASLNSTIPLKYQIFYYTLTLVVYLIGRGFVQVNLIRFTSGLIYELRLNLVDKIFSTSYQKLEKIDRGRLYTVINNDVDAIGGSANMIVTLITSVFTALGAFLYLASIAFWATVLTISAVVTISVLYFFVSRSTQKYLVEARDTQNLFVRQINGMIDGFKELSINRNKNLAYKADIAATAHVFRQKTSVANIYFVNAFLVGELFLIVLLGAVVFAIPRLFPEIQFYVLMSFVIVLLYLIGPVNSLLNAVPAIMQLKIAWRRIQQLLKDIPANLDHQKTLLQTDVKVESLKGEGIRFTYKGVRDEEAFEMGPIDLEVKSGEILFVIGGNGSGKTTLAKLLTGLYEPDEGKFLINNKPVEGHELSGYYSTVFNPLHLFNKIYDVDTNSKADLIMHYLKLLRLNNKVEVVDGQYSTIDLSGGQRKRLALLQCYLEDRPIYLLDEWAADQDPEYRNFFYRRLLPDMRALGKAIIVITHDDHYFDVADKILKMNRGKAEYFTGTLSAISTSLEDS